MQWMYMPRISTSRHDNLDVFPFSGEHSVYELGEVSAKLVCRSLGKHADTMFVNLYETHFSYIRDMNKFSHSQVEKRRVDRV